MAGTRAPAVAGSFYPADSAELAGQVDLLLGPHRRDDGAPPALVAPHAGYACSGAVAASAYRRVGRSAEVRSVVVLGPAHYRDPHGVAFPEAAAWSTPLGDVPVDRELCVRLGRAGLAHGDDRAHRREHAVEVQLPFLQRVLGDGWACVPLAVHGTDADTVADCLDLVAGDHVLVVCSTDLSHYFDEPTATRLDRRTARAIVDRDPAVLGEGSACGVYPLRGVLAWARRHDLEVEVLDLGTSAQTCGGPDRVVGYGAFALAPSRAGGVS
jgi:AmmeMemoRadiSam system protein B